MQWIDVEITTNKGKRVTGEKAKKFIYQNCQDAKKKIGTVNSKIRVRLRVNEEWTEETNQIRLVFFLALRGNAKSLRFLNDKRSEILNLEVARAALNTLNTVSNKLRVEFIYKPDPRTDTVVYLKNPIVSVTADYAGNGQSSAAKIVKNADQGIVEFEKPAAGKYTLTPDFSSLEKCEFDYEIKPQVIDLKSGGNETVIFEVEPLYQKVQLVAHCLLAIADFTYVLSENDLTKVKIDKNFDWNNLSFNEKPASERTYKAEDCGKQVEAVIVDDESEAGYGKLTMNEKDLTEYYGLSDLPVFDKTKIEIKGSKGGNPNQYIVEFKEKQPDVPIYPLQLNMKNDGFSPFKLEDITDVLDYGLIENIEPTGELDSRKYMVTFKEDYKPKDLKKKLPSTTGLFGEKELYQPSDLGLSKEIGEFVTRDKKEYAHTENILNLMVKEGDEYWKLDDLDDYLKDEFIEAKYRDASEETPNQYIIKFKANCSPASLEPPLPDEIGAFGKKSVYPDLLNMNKKKRPVVYWTLDELGWIEDVKDLIEITGFHKDFGQQDIKNMPTFAYKDKVSKEIANKRKLEEKIKEKDSQFAKKVKILGLGAQLRFSLQEKPPPPEYYKLSELQDTLLQKIVTPQESDKQNNNPPVYKVKFKSESAKYTQDDLDGKWMARYHGLYKDEDDMNARLKLVEATLKVAHNHADQDPTILKMFMLPECYFQGRYGAYRVEEADVLLKGLLNLVGDAQWRDWMFVFGTVNLTFGDEIREMMNYSPVVRGGLGPVSDSGGGGENDKRLRLIQKLINSAELLDESELLHTLKSGDKKGEDLKEAVYYEVRPSSDIIKQKVIGINKENYDEVRMPSVNDAVQFQATQNEEQVGKFLKRAFLGETVFNEKGIEVDEPATDPNFGVACGLKDKEWKELLTELERNVNNLGLTRVARLVRVCKIKDTPDDLSKWGRYSGYANSAEANREPLAKIGVTSEWMILRFIKEGWERHHRNEPRIPELATPNSEQGKAILEDIKDNRGEFFQKFGITLPSQKDKLNNEIEKLATETELIELVKPRTKEFSPPDNFGASIYPMWKKILELFLRTNPSVTTFDAETMNFRDYCFAIRRKAGPLVPLTGKDGVADLDPCKKLVLGLEICADHGSGERLKKALTERKPIPMLSLDDDRFEKKEIIEEENVRRAEENKIILSENAERAKVKIDIQLVPSAGYYPTDNSIAARESGYCFNCDGWNKGSGKGVNYIRSMFDGPSGPKHDSRHPITPHTAIAKGGDKVKRNMPLFKPTRIKLSDEPDTKDFGEGILNRSGLGELHIYKPLDLPKD